MSANTNVKLAVAKRKESKLVKSPKSALKKTSRATLKESKAHVASSKMVLRNHTAVFNEVVAGESREMTQLPSSEVQVTIIPEEEKPFHPIPRSFNRYLDFTGIKHGLIRALIAIYEEQQMPDQPAKIMSYLMGYGYPETERIERFQDYIQKLCAKNSELQITNASLKETFRARKIDRYRLIELHQQCIEYIEKLPPQEEDDPKQTDETV